MTLPQMETVALKQHQWTSWWFLKGLGLVYLLVFLGIREEVMLLIGSDGLIPAAQYFGGYQGQALVGFFETPSIFIFSASDSALNLAALIGFGASIGLVLGFWPILMTSVLWVIFLSFFKAGQGFFGGAGDELLLEVGFLAILIAPWSLRLLPVKDPSKAVVWIMRWMIAKIFLFSVLDLYLSYDGWGERLASFEGYFQAQPAPFKLGYFIQSFPPYLIKFAAAAGVILSLLVPFFIVFRRFTRILVFWFIFVFQIVAILSGANGLFNYVVLVMTVFLLDDTWMYFVWPPEWLFKIPLFHVYKTSGGLVKTAASVGVAVLVVIFSFEALLKLFGVGHLAPDIIANQSKLASRFELVHLNVARIGPLPTARTEIVIEAESNLRGWEEINFLGRSLGRRARLPVYSYRMSRLNRALWESGQKGHKRASWVQALMAKVLFGDPKVVKLYSKPEQGAQHYRAVGGKLYNFAFLYSSTHEGRHWMRENAGQYGSPIKR